MSEPARVTITGATGLIGRALTAALLERGARVTVLSRDPERARELLGAEAGGDSLQAQRWDPAGEPAPEQALCGRDGVVHLAGANVARRWSSSARQQIRESRVRATANLIAGLERCRERPAVLVSASAVGYYGARGEEPLDEEAPPGTGFLAEVCTAWEAESERAGELGMRVVVMRNGVVLDARGGALAKMLIPFRLGLGGPVAGGRQYISWIHRDDLTALLLAALAEQAWQGPVNATAPEPVTNFEFSRALGRALHRPALLPVPGLGLRLLYGEMASVITTGARALPAKALVLGFRFGHPEAQEALSSALSSR